MVAGMVVGVAAQNIEHQPGKQLFQCNFRISETVANNLGQCFVAGIARHHFIQPQ